MSWGDTELAIVVPTYNERENLPVVVERLWELGLKLGLVVVDDGSPDGTGELAEELAGRHKPMHVIHRPGKLGLGSAYREGFAWVLENTPARLVGQMDADLSHDPRDVPRLVEVARTGAVAIGSRYVPGGGVRNWPWHRRLISRMGSAYARVVLGVGVRDLTGGFKCWPRQALEAINLGEVISEGYAFQVEMTYRAIKAGFRVTEVPIVFTDRRLGSSKMSLAIALEAAWVVWAMRFRVGE